ncbi:MAG: excinuclease ABC subunit UvrC [Patescibacteria group bacterium]|jgi:excinuclease ABC subunit C
MDKLAKKLKNLPKTPGVYIFKNKQRNILYVGKAKNLRSRVRSYFQKSRETTAWQIIMRRQINDLEIIKVESEDDALVLENELIKKFKPRFNIMLKDDKGYLYVEITAEDYPRVLLVRQPNFKNGSAFFGPYPSAKSLRLVHKLLHRVFPFRTCHKLPKKPCLEFYMNRCSAPCKNKISQKQYQNMIKKTIDFFEGKNQAIYKITEKKMRTAAHHEQFEKAALYRNQLQAIDRLKEIIKTPEDYLKKYYEQKHLNIPQGLKQLAAGLRLNNLKRVEIFDISNIQGKFAVGSMVVFTNGLPDKNNYRKFKIKTVFQSNDTAMMKEVIKRRLRHNEWGRPDLIMLDGGAGQLSACLSLIKKANIPVIALAKREEEIYQAEQKDTLRLKPNTAGYFLLQRMRDEAHRFAITYYRKLHRRSLRV